MAPFNSFILICWSLFLLVWFMSSLGVKKASQEGVERQRSWIRLLVFFAIVYFFNPNSLQKLVGMHLLSSNPFVGSIGVVICVAGVAFAIWAKFHLGSNWGAPMTVKEKPELITTGPYRFVRHPIYSGICVGMLGSALVGGLPWFIWFILLSASFVYSAKQEEKTMESQFSIDYRDYKKRTKMLLPFVF